MQDTQIEKSGLKQQTSTVWVLTATILGSSMAFIDGSAVGVALPVLQTDLGRRLLMLSGLSRDTRCFWAH